MNFRCLDNNYSHNIEADVHALHDKHFHCILQSCTIQFHLASMHYNNIIMFFNNNCLPAHCEIYIYYIAINGSAKLVALQIFVNSQSKRCI